MISISYLFEDVKSAAKGAVLVGGLVAGGGALYNKIKHGEAFGDQGIDIPKSALGSAGLTFAFNALSPSEQKAVKKELSKSSKSTK